MAQQPAPPLGQQQSWWSTLPGVLTATAGFLTAVTGLIVALSALGFTPLSEPTPDRGASATQAGGSVDSSGASASRPPAQSAPSREATYVVAFPSGKDAEVTNTRSGDVVYTILESSVKQPSAQQLELTLSVRLTNNGRMDVLFGDDSFRLLVEGVPRAPDNYLNASVDARSAGEATVVFSVPADAGQLLLRIGDSYVDNPAELPLVLRKA